MAVLTNDQLAKMRNILEDLGVVDYNKGEVNSMFQSIEDDFQDRKVAVSTLIDTATSPKVFTNPQKKRADAAYYIFRFEEDK